MGVRSLSASNSIPFVFFSFFEKRIGSRRLSTANPEERCDFSISACGSAYEVLGVSESSSFAEIKASFRKLAKETHPDLSRSSSSSHRFLQILAAYEILSDSKKRAHYDNYLFSQRQILRKRPISGSVMYMYNSSLGIMKQGEVVEWLQWYRIVIDDILTERRVAIGSGYIYELESELYSAIRAAYYGPLIESMDFLPDRFEAEERSVYDTPEVLHLVSGRDLFGVICLADNVPQLSDARHAKLTSFSSTVHDFCQDARLISTGQSTSSGNSGALKTTYNKWLSDVYKDLELHISGRLVATASRSPPACNFSKGLEVDHDKISVFLNLDDDKEYMTDAFPRGTVSSSGGSQILLGTISGLGSKAEEGLCSVYDQNGTKTHVIMKHRTLMVKHMHWYHVGDVVSACECRCSRARLPSSKFWLFEPRCSMHDIGGWYVETFGRDKKGMTIPSQRQWDGLGEYPEKRLHPAMYLLALAYRTLDLEDAKRRKRTVKDFVEPKLSVVLRWCKKLM